MDEIRLAGIGSRATWSLPNWPLLGELGNTLYSVREVVIREEAREYLQELSGFDYRLIRTAVTRRCGELFTVGLDGYRKSYQISSSNSRGKLRETIRDRIWTVADAVFVDQNPLEVFPFVNEVVRHQARLLSDAMSAGNADDYQQLHESCIGWLRLRRFYWDTDILTAPEVAQLCDRLEQDYRIVLMSLAGRAMVLADAGRIEDASPYMAIGRGLHDHPEQLAQDIGKALERDGLWKDNLWVEWRIGGAVGTEVEPGFPEQYPLLFFAVRLIELSTESMPVLDLEGKAQKVFMSFRQNSKWLGPYVIVEHDHSAEQKRELASNALKASVHRDQEAEDWDVIERDLNHQRISCFISEVKAAVSRQNYLERLFEREGSFLYLTGDNDDNDENPVEQDLMVPVEKVIFTDTDRIIHQQYRSANAKEWGRAISLLVVNSLYEALAGAPLATVALGTSQDFVKAVNAEIESLNPSGELAIVLAGDFSDVLTDLAMELPEGYVPGCRSDGVDQDNVVGRYRGHALLEGPTLDERSLCIVDPATWGCYLRGQYEDAEDLRIEVKLVSSERARELLDKYQSHFPNEPNEESKLQKFQTFVEVTVAYLQEFRVDDPLRARRIVDANQM